VEFGTLEGCKDRKIIKMQQAFVFLTKYYFDVLDMEININNSYFETNLFS
jgi:hypothetical protein